VRRRRQFGVKIRELKLAGEEVSISFEPDTNDFRAELAGEEIADKDFNALLNTLRKKAKEYKPTVQIPVTKIEHGAKGNAYTDLTVTGIHSGNRNIMAREDATGEVHQYGWYQFADNDPDREREHWDRTRSTPHIVRRLTADERFALDDMTIEINNAEKRRDMREQSFRIQIGVEIKRARQREKARLEESLEDDAREGDPRVAKPDHRSRKRR
jgi:hypothetical protein